mgnify:CR=1 FL=1
MSDEYFGPEYLQRRVDQLEEAISYVPVILNALVNNKNSDGVEVGMLADLLQCTLETGMNEERRCQRRDHE